MLKLKGALAVLVAAVLLSIPMYFYWEFLTRGMRPPESTQILNRLERTGVPDFTLNDLDGHPVSLNDFAGKVVLINVWATWCAPCVKEFPSLKRLVEKFGGQIVVLAVSYDHDREDILTFIEAFGGLPKAFRVVWDKDKRTSSLLGTDVLPETYILTPDRKLIRKVAGETTWDDPVAQQFFTELLHPERRSLAPGGGG